LCDAPGETSPRGLADILGKEDEPHHVVPLSCQVFFLDGWDMMGYLNIFDIFCMGHVGQDFWTRKPVGFLWQSSFIWSDCC
jgi:hypothetical protein